MMDVIYQPYLLFIATAIGLLGLLWLKEVRSHSKKNISIEKLQALSQNERSALLEKEFALKNCLGTGPTSSVERHRSPTEMVETTISLEKIAAVQEWQNKYQKLEQLFQEKSTESENIEKALVTEVKNRKEFEKVRELLERRILDLKEKNHELHTELVRLKSERSSQRSPIDTTVNPIPAFDEKINSLSKNR